MSQVEPVAGFGVLMVSDRLCLFDVRDDAEAVWPTEDGEDFAGVEELDRVVWRGGGDAGELLVDPAAAGLGEVLTSSSRVVRSLVRTLIVMSLTVMVRSVL
ncbi:hypothetical protein [Streptomyces halobius]|uniref:Uncharacterized protein n=1 Tax=Streptomyces halobius TaxID=2879846 RepID=A0ABY4MA41_9ACTN|nr:hypothetical protein [Streptomyces halobius]UQA93659.1 hypothetical protein K9S39_18965 [Streptomyces halobius]